MATKNKVRTRITNRGKIVILVFLTLIGLAVARAVDQSEAASFPAPGDLSGVRLMSASGAETKGHFTAQDTCTDPVIGTLKRAGFTGRDLREAWAIVMRESAGQADLVSHAVDHGLFQFNIDAHRDKHWWNTKKLLTPDYNARVAYLTSQGGKDWLMWGLTDKGHTDARMYPMWTEDQVYRWITEPFQRYFAEFAELPRGCRR